MALIELRGVIKRYRVGEQEIVALNGIDLTIEQGEYAAIIGPSGSGKSTLMHLLGCLDTPTSGRMSIDGIDVSRASGNRLAELRNQKIGFVFQAFNLLAKFNVLQNVELPMIYSGVPAKERIRKAMIAIERVGREGAHPEGDDRDRAGGPDEPRQEHSAAALRRTNAAGRDRPRARELAQ